MQIEQLCGVFPGLPAHQQTRVAEDVRQAAQATLYSRARARPSSVVIELEDAVAQVRARPGKSILLGPRAWVLVGGDPEAEERVLPRRQGCENAPNTDPAHSDGQQSGSATLF
jgi:hypothetical protein